MSDRALHRRRFLESMGVGSLGALSASGLGGALGGALSGALGRRDAVAAEPEPTTEKRWEPISDRKIRFGIVGYGECRFGAEFGFQDHPNVEIVAVSDLIPERCQGLMRACRCAKSYESLEVLVKDPKIEAVFVATDAPSHARHCIEVLKHGKHVMTAVPATMGSVEEGEQLLETVKTTGLKYMMAETSCYRADCYAMRQAYRAGALGRLVYSEGEYYHYRTDPIPSFRGWRIGFPPLWYPTHATAYYVGVADKQFTSVSCVGFRGDLRDFGPGANRYNNPFTDEVALLETEEGGTSRMAMCKAIHGLFSESGRVYGEQGWMIDTTYHGTSKALPELARPPLPPGVPAGGHGGSHGQLSNEFVAAILEDRRPAVDIYAALWMTIPGVIAHQSALKGGERLKVPQYPRPA